MSFLDALRHRLRVLRDREGYDRELRAEREFHLSLERMHLEAEGLSPQDAAAGARRRYGNLTTQHEARRRLFPLHVVEQYVGDVRFALRQLRRAPAFSFGVIGTLALGLGANAAMFDLLDRLLLRPPAFLADAQATHRVYLSGGAFTQPIQELGYRRASALATWTSSFTTTAVQWSTQGMMIGTGADARELPVTAVSASYWRLFTMQPATGRFFTDDDDRPPTGRAVAVLSHDYWRTQFGGRANVIGTTLHVGPMVFEIVGVTPAGFTGTGRGPTPAVFIPVSMAGSYVMGGDDPAAWVEQYCCGWLQMLVVRAPGVSVEQATADLTHAYQRTVEEERLAGGAAPPAGAAPPRAEAGSILPDRGPLRSRSADVVVWLAGVAAIVLLIACANVVNLTVARAQRRTHEFAVRTALGVSSRRLFEQLLAESMTLALIGGAAGLLLAAVIRGPLGEQLLGVAGSGGRVLDGRVILFTVVTAGVAGLLVGLYPALRVARRGIMTGLRSGSRGGGRDGAGLRGALLAAQAAFSVLLLVGAALFVRSMHNVRALPLGFDADRLVYVYPRARAVELTVDEREALLERIVQAARELPSVEQAARAVSVPFWNSRTPRMHRANGDSLDAMGPFVLQTASPEYFRTMGTPLLQGRGIAHTDTEAGEPVLVVSDSMARRLWPNGDAIGSCLRIGTRDAPCRRVVGIAASIRRSGLLRDAGMQYYVPVPQGLRGGGGVIVRLRGDGRTGAESVRQALHPLVPGDGYLAALPLRDVIDPLTASWRLGATVFTGFGVLALLLACGGLYSVIAYDVARRRHELGVRLALGAQQHAIVALVLRTNLRITLTGVVIGMGIALAAAPWLRGQLFEVSPHDPVSLVLAAMAMVVAATVAVVVPARRAAGIDPAISLREG